MADRYIPLGLYVLAGLTALGAVIRVVASDAKVLDRLDLTTLFYFAVAGALLMLRQVKTLSFKDFKLEMLEKIQEQQAKQKGQIEDIALMLPLLLPETERKHLLNLAQSQTGGYHGRGPLRDEMRRLRSMGLIKMRSDRHVSQMKDGAAFNLAEYAELTPLGQRWVRRIQEIEQAEATRAEVKDADVGTGNNP